MAYTPPANDAVDFALESYSAPANDGVDFELESAVAVSGTVAETQPKSSEAASGSESYSLAVSEAQKAQDEEAQGGEAFAGTATEAQGKQDDSVDATIGGNYIRDVLENPVYAWVPIRAEVPPISGQVSEDTERQTDAVSGHIGVVAIIRESAKTRMRANGRVGRGRAERERDMDAILRAIA